MFIGILFITNNGSAQNYESGISARFRGLTSGLTVKHFVSNTSAIEDGASYYYNDHRLYTSSVVSGMNGITSMEYIFKDTPVDRGPDFKPFIDFFNSSTAYFDGGYFLSGPF